MSLEIGGSSSSDNVRVCCRVRPLSEKELKGFCVDTKETDEGFISCRLGAVTGVNKDSTASNQYSFHFDRVFPTNSPQKKVYEYAALPTVKSVMEGFNGTVFAYGQTASGKTYTMQGPDMIDENLQGVIPRMVWTIFDAIYSAPPTQEFLVKVSMVELYMEKIRCLLDPSGTAAGGAGKDNLKIKERPDKGVYIDGATESYVQSENEIFDALSQAQYNRTVGATNMNAVSSRSHMIFQLTVENKDTVKNAVKRGKLFLVDLAGSEKIQRTGATGSRLEEAKMINKSLSALGNVINALTEPGKSHVPYRDSKLTRLLSESLGGNAKTTLIITVSPSSANDAETLSTLRFGQRAKMIKNRAVVNEDLSVEALNAKVVQLREIVARSKNRVKALEGLLSTNGIPIPDGSSDGAQVESGTEGDVGEPGSGAQALSEQQQEELAELQRENVELRADVEQAEKAAFASQQKLQETQTELQAVSYERDELQSQLARLQADLATQKAENESLKLEKKNLKAEVAEAKEQCEQQKVKGMQVIAGKLQDERATAPANILQICSRELLADDDIVDASCKVVLSVMKDLAEGNIRLSRENELAQQDREGEMHSLLREREAAVTKLEMELASERERAADLHDKLKDGDRPLKRKVSQLDKNLEQLTVMYHKLVSQNSGLKVECQVNEKKVVRKDQRIAALENSLRDAKSKYEKLLTQCANLTAAMDMMSSREKGSLAVGAGNKGRLMRPLQGGVRSIRASGSMLSIGDPVPERGGASGNSEETGRATAKANASQATYKISANFRTSLEEREASSSGPDP
ncbi:unnamed protein product [Amoebophrya sp. A120]|nr:unnamed protein product [Amoebophrya sp. A120]|eukprot:GSA120T00018909001.1